jgi:hypothetical protein
MAVTDLVDIWDIVCRPHTPPPPWGKIVASWEVRFAGKIGVGEDTDGAVNPMGREQMEGAACLFFLLFLSDARATVGGGNWK